MAELKLKVTTDTGSLKSELAKAMKEPSKIIEKAFKSIGSVGGKAGGVLNAFPIGGAGGALLAGAGAIIGILKGIHDSINKMVEKLGEASASFRGTRDAIDKMYNQALKPLGDVMSNLMRPYLMLIMRRTRETLKQIKPFMEGASQGNQADIDAITKIIQENMADISFITQKMNDVIKPIAGSLDGFRAGLDIVFQNWLTGTKEYMQSFLAATNMALSTIPPSLVAFLKQNEASLSSVPKNIAEAYEKAIAAPDKTELLASKLDAAISANLNLIGSTFLNGAKALNSAFASAIATLAQIQGGGAYSRIGGGFGIASYANPRDAGFRGNGVIQ